MTLSRLLRTTSRQSPRDDQPLTDSAQESELQPVICGKGE
jgi:hypothetical protein